MTSSPFSTFIVISFYFLKLFFEDFFWCGPFWKSLLNLLQHCFCFMFWFFGHEQHEILAPQPGLKRAPPVLEGEVLTTGPPEKPLSLSFLCPRCPHFPVSLSRASTCSWLNSLLTLPVWNCGSFPSWHPLEPKINCDSSRLFHVIQLAVNFPWFFSPDVSYFLLPIFFGCYSISDSFNLWICYWDTPLNVSYLEEKT